jgi:hypothetical protein
MIIDRHESFCGADHDRAVAFTACSEFSGRDRVSQAELAEQA